MPMICICGRVIKHSNQYVVKVPCEITIVEPDTIYIRVPGRSLGLDTDKYASIPVMPRIYATRVGCYLSFRGILDPLLEGVHGMRIPVCIAKASFVTAAIFKPTDLCH